MLVLALVRTTTTTATTSATATATPTATAAQASVLALTQPAAIVCPQLQRFTGEAGAIQRDSRLLLGYQCDIHLPVFGGLDDTAVQCLPYKVVAMQLHYGESPTKGHYRSILIGQQSFGKGFQWLTDEGCASLPMSREHDSAYTYFGCSRHKTTAMSSENDG